MGQDGLGEARLSCPELLYRESQTEACAEAMPASTHTWLAATAQQRPLRTLPDLVGMCTFQMPSTPVSLNFPVPKQTMFTTLLLCLHHSLGHLIYKNILYTKTKQNVFHHCLPANSFLKKTSWRKPQMPQTRPVILLPQEQAWA